MSASHRLPARASLIEDLTGLARAHDAEPKLLPWPAAAGVIVLLSLLGWGAVFAFAVWAVRLGHRVSGMG
jgi:hypothetical protein